MRPIFTLIWLVTLTWGYAQPSDFIILKNRGKTIKSFYSGTQIEFVSTTGAYRNALINRIANDTMYLQEFLIRRIPTTLGTYIIDTAGSFRYAYHYNQVKLFGRESKKFNLMGSGSSLIGGGILLVLASGVVYLADRDNFSPELMGAAAVLATGGYLIKKNGSKGMAIGKKYTLEYMDVTP
ncbi:MAG: hypothetical protein ABIO05_07420 [Ferruginibacter sp.]